MSHHAKRLQVERKDKADEEARIKFAEAIDAASQYPDAGYQAMKNQFHERYGEHYTQVFREGRGR